MSIEILGISKNFGSFKALDDVTLTIGQGELLALLGPSGSGKTTLLRVLAGLELPDVGKVQENGHDLTALGARDRNVGLVFQHFALFPHLDVFENIAFSLRVRKRPPAEVHERVEELLHLVQLEGLAHRRPAELSGGQRQRVALARALAARPRVLLLDEPFSALDAKVRHELRTWLRRLHEELGTTTVFVTHDQDEAFELADRVAVFHRGRIEQLGTPDEIYDTPKSPFVLDFLGNVQWLEGVEKGPVAVRHRDVTLHVDGVAGWPARIVRIHRTGPRVRVDLQLATGQLLIAALEPPAAQGLFVGQELRAVAERQYGFGA